MTATWMDFPLPFDGHMPVTGRYEDALPREARVNRCPGGRGGCPPPRQGLLEQTRSEPYRFRDRFRSPEGVALREWRSTGPGSSHHRLHDATNTGSIHGTWRRNDSGEVSDDGWRRLIIPLPPHQQIPSFPSQERTRRLSMTTRDLIRSNSH